MMLFILNKILQIIGFKRSENVDLSDDVIKESFNLLHQFSWDKSFISPVWDKVFSRFGKSKLNEEKDKIDKSELKESYENFFVNGLSDGACVGADLTRPRSAIKYAIRGNYRYKLLNKHYDFAGRKLNLESLEISKEMQSGKPWLQKISGKWINPEVIDHLYFFEICRDLPVPFDNILFIGEGSGILSNIFLNRKNIKSAVFIDLPHFLIRQHITNYASKNTVQSYITPNQLEDLVHDNQRRVLVNQDSFPEIPEEYLNRYFDLIDTGYITDIFSYNKKDSSEGHSNFREILLKRNIKCKLSVESVMRKDYFIEWYSTTNS
ncbi:hypothetical protein N8474_00145 [Gammaproteobacteria bacterium]|nr:hypothetical protein [Gammaproteobacteria bacterium]